MKKMLRKFTNAKTGQTIVFEKNMKPTLKNIEEVIGQPIKGNVPLQDKKEENSDTKDKE